MPSSKNILLGQQSSFHKVFNELKTTLVDNKNDFNRFAIFSYCLNDCVMVQSVEFEPPSCIPGYLLKIYENFTYLAFLYGVRCTVTKLLSNRIMFIKSWSIFEEAISFLNYDGEKSKKRICCWSKKNMNQK